MEEKINNLVLSIQNILGKALNVDVEEIQMTSEQLFTAINDSCSGEFTELYDAIAEKTRNSFARRLPIGIYIDKDDISQDFLIKKLPKIIVNYKKDKGNFTSYLRRSITRYCFDIYDWWRARGGEVTDQENDDGAVPPSSSIGTMTDPTEIISLMEFLKIFFQYLDRINTRADKKMVYHCIILDALECIDCYSVLREWRGNSFKSVSNFIEQEYGKFFGTETKFMQGINKQMEKTKIAEKSFLMYPKDIDIDVPDGKRRISGYTSDVKEALRIYASEIFEAFKEAVIVKMTPQLQDKLERSIQERLDEASPKKERKMSREKDVKRKGSRRDKEL